MGPLSAASCRDIHVLLAALPPQPNFQRTAFLKKMYRLFFAQIITFCSRAAQLIEMLLKSSCGQRFNIQNCKSCIFEFLIKVNCVTKRHCSEALWCCRDARAYKCRTVRIFNSFSGSCDAKKVNSHKFLNHITKLITVGFQAL